MRSRKSKIALWAAIGFAVLAAYIVIPEGNTYGWQASVTAYLVGTGIGAGIVGALVGGLIAAVITRKSRSI